MNPNANADNIPQSIDEDTTMSYAAASGADAERADLQSIDQDCVLSDVATSEEDAESVQYTPSESSSLDDAPPITITRSTDVLSESFGCLAIQTDCNFP